ncbi:arginyl-tRNA synthetase [Thozetella sp. PMI_491]|nr:arginyl-tRNA synthetase [Thozetella sp. PMI_491]
MAATSLDELPGLLGNLGLEDGVPEFPQADVTQSPLDIFHSYLADAVQKLTGCEPEVAYQSIQWSTDVSNGDLVVVIPKLRLKDVNPSEYAFDLVQKFPPSPLFLLPVPDGIHLRVFFSSQALPRLLLPYIYERGPGYGTKTASSAPDPKGKKLVVEFSSPNIGTEFNGSHLRSTIVGSYIASTYEKLGWEVTRLNYLGDWGKQIGLLAAGWTRFGSDELFTEDPLRHLLDVYEKIEELFKPEVEASRKARDEGKDTAEIESRDLYAERDAFFKRMEDGDAEALALWKKFREVSIEHYKKLYAALDVTFNEYSGESQVSPAIITEVEELLKEKGVSEESDGSWVVDFKKYGHKGLGTAIMRGRTGSTTYLLRDVASLIERDRKYGFDKMIYVAAMEQDSHFQRIFTTLELMGLTDLRAKVQHIAFAKVLGLSRTAGTPTGGRGILLGDIIDQCHNAMREAIKEQDPESFEVMVQSNPTAIDKMGIFALLVQELAVKRMTTCHFEPDKMVSLDTNSGARLQHWYTKLCSKLATSASSSAGTDLAGLDYTSIEQDEYTDLLRVLAQFPDITHGAFRTDESSTVLAYLFRLVDHLNYIIPDEEDDLGVQPTGAQLALFGCVRHVFDNAFSLLGIQPFQM